MSDWKHTMKEELDTWRVRLEEARLQAGLAKLELREKREQTLKDFRHRYAEAKARLDQLRDKASKEWDASAKALEAGWKTLHETYQHAKNNGEASSG